MVPRVDWEVAVATLTAWKFPEAGSAKEAVDVLEDLRSRGLIHVVDAAWVTWPEGTKAPMTHQLHDARRAGMVGGGLWGLLFGMIFLVPVIGLAVGAAAGALTASLTDVGIDEGFVSAVREKVTPGTSALFALTAWADQDAVRQAFGGFHAELITSNLSSEQEQRLRATFPLDT